MTMSFESLPVKSLPGRPGQLHARPRPRVSVCTCSSRCWRKLHNTNCQIVKVENTEWDASHMQVAESGIASYQVVC